MKATRSDSLWIVAGVAILAAMVASLSPSLVVISVTAAEPAAVFPAETVVYFEIRKPVEHLEILSSLGVWGEASAVISAMTEALDEEAFPGAVFCALNMLSPIWLTPVPSSMSLNFNSLGLLRR